MEGYLRVDNDGNVSLLSNLCPVWSDSLDELTGGHFDAATGTLTYDVTYYGSIAFHVVLHRQ